MVVAGLCGLPAARLVDGDELERALWLRITTRASDLRVQIMKAEAAHIANALARVLR